MTREVFDHFDAAARDYAARSGGGLWGVLRRREARTLLAMLDPKPVERILDAGCGAGHYAALIQESGAAVTGVDGSAAMVEAARARGIEARVHDLAAQPPPGGPYDKILCAGVLEFCQEDVRILACLAAALRPDGGSLVVMMPRISVFGLLYKIHHRLQGLPCILRSRAEVERWAALGLRLVDLQRVGFNWAARFVRPSDPSASVALAMSRRLGSELFDECPVWVERDTPFGAGLCHPSECLDLQALADSANLRGVWVRCRAKLASGETLRGCACVAPRGEEAPLLEAVFSFIDDRESWCLEARGPNTANELAVHEWVSGGRRLTPEPSRRVAPCCPCEVFISENAPALADSVAWVRPLLSRRWSIRVENGERVPTDKGQT